MLDVPTQQDRDWLLDRLAELIARCGHEHFVSAPVINGTTRYFPDAWRAEPAGVQVVARRLLWHTGFRDVRVRVRDTRGRMRPSTTKMLSDTEVWFADERNGVIELELAAVGNDDIIGILSHEVGVVFRALRGFDDHGAHPFRSPLTPPGDADDPSDEHRVTVLGSLTAVYLGLGLMATNASHSARHAGVIDGNVHSVEWSHTRAGGLPPQAMSFLCAVHAVVRDDDEPYQGLLPNQARDFRAWRDQLGSERAVLVERLGLPPLSTWPAPETVETVEPFNDEHYDDTDALDDEERKRFNRGHSVFLVRHPSTMHRVFGVLLGVGSSAIIVPTVGMIAGVAVGAACIVMGLFLGRKSRKGYCSEPACREPLATTDRECPRCGGMVAGELAQPNERLDIEEALAAEKEDADA